MSDGGVEGSCDAEYKQELTTKTRRMFNDG